MSKYLLMVSVVLGTFAIASPAHAQDEEAQANAEADATVQAEVPAHPDANPADVESIDAIIAALYDVISGPAGERDWDRFRSLFTPGAVLSAMVPRPDGSHPARVFSYEDYVRLGGQYFMENAFFERETGRKLLRFGNVANAMSAYESRNAPDEEPFTNGINTITLITDGDRWYVVSIAWDEVRDANPMPDWIEALATN
jgi:hypothetical protein